MSKKPAGYGTRKKLYFDAIKKAYIIESLTLDIEFYKIIDFHVLPILRSQPSKPVLEEIFINSPPKN